MRLFFTFLLCLIGVAAHAADQQTLFGMKGEVDSICIITDDGGGFAWQVEIVFDEDGNVLEIDGVEVEVTRDSDGRLTSVTIEDEDEEGNPVLILTKLNYNRQNRVSRIESTSGNEKWSEKYVYDSAGLLIKKEFSGPEDTDTYTYQYVKTDKHGNWTKRIEKATMSGVAVEQTRNITYID